MQDIYTYQPLLHLARALAKAVRWLLELTLADWLFALSLTAVMWLLATILN